MSAATLAAAICRVAQAFSRMEQITRPPRRRTYCANCDGILPEGCSCLPDQTERADTQDAQMWRAVVGMYAKMDPRNCGYCGQPNGGVHKSDCKRPQTSPAASTAGDSAGAVSEPPSPAPACPDDAAAEWIGGAVPVISAVLDRHRHITQYLYGDGVYVCSCNRAKVLDPQAWRDHISPLIANALAPQPKPAFPETGYDMGISLEGCTHAAEFSPQQRHTK